MYRITFESWDKFIPHDIPNNQDHGKVEACHVPFRPPNICMLLRISPRQTARQTSSNARENHRVSSDCSSWQAKLSLASCCVRVHTASIPNMIPANTFSCGRIRKCSQEPIWKGGGVEGLSRADCKPNRGVAERLSRDNCTSKHGVGKQVHRSWPESLAIAKESCDITYLFVREKRA